MLSYCLKCKENTENIKPDVLKANDGKITLLSKCAICGSKKSRFMKKQEAKEILSSQGLKTKLSKISLLDTIFFLMQFHWRL